LTPTSQGFSRLSILAAMRGITDCPTFVLPCPRPLRWGILINRFSPASACYYRGIAWFAKGEFKRAIGDLDEAIKLNPRLADAYCSRGVAQLRLGKLVETEADFARCRALGATPMPEAERLLREARERRSPR
jgi:tetratricopeptide (TPR) repeat protein